ncbi:hypothetical protein BC567DRAFT_239584 [Phyllosticta citribraziliensis]
MEMPGPRTLQRNPDNCARAVRQLAAVAVATTAMKRWQRTWAWAPSVGNHQERGSPSGCRDWQCRFASDVSIVSCNRVEEDEVAECAARTRLHMDLRDGRVAGGFLLANAKFIAQQQGRRLTVSRMTGKAGNREKQNTISNLHDQLAERDQQLYQANE